MNAIERLSPATNLDDLQRVSRMMAASGYFGVSGSAEIQIAQIATKILAGAELGFGPFASANGVHIIQGKPAVGANLMASAVKSSGRYDYRVRELTKDVCKLEFFQRIGEKWESVGISEFTRTDAEAAGTKNMDKFARNMLFARAMSNGVRFYAPDVFSGNAVYVPEELGANVDGDGNVIDVQPTQTPQNGTNGTNGHNHTVTVEIVQPEPNNPFEEEQGTPPHQRMWGQGMSCFGPDWNMARAWLLRKWSSKVTPDNERHSASDLSDDEKDLIADYIKDNKPALKGIWAKQKPIEEAKLIAA